MRLYVHKSVISYVYFIKLGKYVNISRVFMYIKFKQFPLKANRDMQ